MDKVGCDLSALNGLRVIEVSDQFTAVGGRMLAELGADVIVVEPLSGSPQRQRPPFARDVPGPNSSLRWWAGNVGKRAVSLDLADPAAVDSLWALVRTADIVIAGDRDLVDGAIGYTRAIAEHPELVWVAVTAFGLHSSRSDQPVTDLTVLSGGGPVWSCGYDDHSIPPIRGAGDQSVNLAGLYSVIGALVAIAHRDQTGEGQLVDVNVNAACNVSSEHTTQHWLIGEQTCLRQTGRHASIYKSSPVQIRCADGVFATTGVLPRKPEDFADLYAWLTELDLVEQLPEAIFLQMAADRDAPLDLAKIGVDDETTATMAAARDAVTLIASRMPAKQFFIESQQRGFPAGVILSPDEAFEDPHNIERGCQIEIAYPETQSAFRYPGAPYIFSETPASPLRRAPHLGEHNALLDELSG
ncbi:carnitine dehydratase [Mycobacterium paraffinicum]|uniref:Carnitine dehydratase n=1 Tax=Mycobacterium paraffinicum TaxID=53378 RepID=A0A1Q4I2D4_9MYCO|nr:CoA transferase [Mycobacterium paraffinicum]OJZ76142.1 carnitine dehydratase [Mycobacterium paraffinicum]